MNDQKFIEEVYELAFGDNAINRDFDREEVLKELRRFSDEALIAEEAIEALNSIKDIMSKTTWRNSDLTINKIISETLEGVNDNE